MAEVAARTCRAKRIFSANTKVRKVFICNRLRSIRTQRERRKAFSLAELVISIGILVLMMSLAGQVFNVTIRSTGQAIALTEINQSLRAFEESLREDLRQVQRGRSVMVIQGNPVNAYWTQRGKEADADGNPLTPYNHTSDPHREDINGDLVSPRADMLMFYTARRGVSYVDPRVTSNLQQVVYGHAELGEYVPGGGVTGPYQFVPLTDPFFPTENFRGLDYPSPTEVMDIPASRWHLARRAVLYLPTKAPRPPTMPVGSEPLNFPTQNNGQPIIAPADVLVGAADVPRLLQGQVDVIGFTSYEALVLRPFVPITGTAGPWFLPPILAAPSGEIELVNPTFGRSQLDVTPPALLADRLGHYALPNCASFKVEWSLDPRSAFVAGRLDGMREVLWIDPGDNGVPGVAGSQPDPLRSIADAIARLTAERQTAPSTERPSFDRKINNLTSLLYDRSFDGSYDNDDTARCLEPEYRCKYSLGDRFRDPNHSDSDPGSVWPTLSPDSVRANLVAFTATRPGPPGPGGALIQSEPVPDAIFPAALRITVDVYDDLGRLERPIRHVMIIPVGE